MDLSSQDPSESSQLDVGLPEVSSTPCFVVLDSQAEHTEGRDEESATQARARRLKQLEELTKNPQTKPSLEMECGVGIQSSGGKESEKRESTKVTTSREELGVKPQASKIPVEEEEEEEEEEKEIEVTSTQDDLFDEEKKFPKQKEDFQMPSTSKDVSQLRGTPSDVRTRASTDSSHITGTLSRDFHTTPTSKDASDLIGTLSEDIKITPPSKDASHIMGTSSEDVLTTPTSKDASHIIGTPSETVGSLRFSGIVLANETSTSGSSASINVVYPSPEAYGPAPLIIPSTPTRPDTNNEEPMELSDNEDVPTAALPHAPLKRKSTTTSDESEDVYRIPAWQQELNQLQQRKEEAANTQDSWLDDNTGSKQQRSLSASIDSTNPSSEHSENIHKSSAELEESLSLQQQQPVMASTTDESSRQSASSRPPSASIVGSRTKDKVSHSAPLLEDTGVGRVSREAKHFSGSSQKKHSSLPEDVASNVETPVTKEQFEELLAKDKSTESQRKQAEIKTRSDGTRLIVNVLGQEDRHADVLHEPDIEIIDDDEEEEDGNKGDDAEEGVDVVPSQDWHLRLSPSQTQTQTQYSIAHREHSIKGVMSQRDLSQTKSKDVHVQEVHEREKTTALKGDGKSAVSRQATPWHSTQADEEDDDDVSIVIPESERLDENKENNRRSSQKLSDLDNRGEKAIKDGSTGKLLESGEGQGMEDSVFLEGEAQLPSDDRLRLGQLGESDNPSPIAGFHLSVPKDGALLRPLSSMTPHLGKKGQWRTDGTPRHSTPIAEETESSNNQREVISTSDRETPKTSSKSASALVVSAVIEMDSAESSEIPAFNLRNPVDRDELLKEVKESPSKKQKSVFSRVTEATKAAKSNTRTKKQTGQADKDPFSLTKPKSRLILGKKRNQQSLPPDDPPQGTSGGREEVSKEQDVANEEEHGGAREAQDVAMEEQDDSATIPLDYRHDDEPRTDDPEVEVVEERKKEDAEAVKTRQEETQQYGANEEHEAEVEMEIDAEEDRIEEDRIEEEQKEEEKMEEVEERSSKEQQVIVSQERRRDPYEFTESQSNRTPTPMKTWGRKEDTVPKEKLPSRNLGDVSSIKQTAEQPSTSARTPKTKRTPKGSRQTRGGKRKRPQDKETTEEEGDSLETPVLTRTRTSPRKPSSTVRKAPRKRGKVPGKQQSKGQVAHSPSERPPPVTSPSMTQRVVQDPMQVAAEQSSASLELRQIPGQSPPTRQPIPWKIVRYKKVIITQRIKEVVEWGELVETTVLEQVVNDEIIEKLEQEFMTPSPPSKTSSLTSGSLADISSLGSRTSSSTAGSLQKSSSVLSTGIQKSISLSSISEVNSSLDKTISLPGSEKNSPNVSGHEQSASGRKLTSPGGVVPQRMPSGGTRASPGVLRHQDSSGISPKDSHRKSFTGGIGQPGISEQSSRTGQVRLPGVSPSSLMISGRKQGGRSSSKGTNTSAGSLSDADGKRVPGGSNAEFTKPTRTPIRRALSRTPEKAEQSTHNQSSNVQSDAPPQINLSVGWNVEEAQQSSEESEGIPCAQPRKENERTSSDEAVEKSDADLGRQTSTTGESLEQRVDVPGPSSRNQEGSSTRPTRGKRRGKAQISTPTKHSLDDTIIVQDDEGGDFDVMLTAPPQESRQQPSAGNASSTSELTTDSAQAFLVPGVRVFTRWMDGFYYPGTIKSEEKNNKLKIAFDDGDLRSVYSKDVIIKDWLSTGQSVMAESLADGYNYPGIVIGYYRSSNPKDSGYFIETDSGETARYPRQKVILSKDQANLLLTSCPSSSTGISDISLENLVEGTRQRSRLRAPSGDGVVRTPSKVLGRTPRRAPSPAVTRSGGKRKAAEKQPTEGDVSPRKKAKQLATRLLTTVAASPDLSKQGIGLRRSPRKQPPHASSSSSPARSLASASRGGPPSTPRTMEMLLGPLPSNKTLFKGMAFFLTQGEVKKRSKIDTSTSDSDNDDDTDEVPFDKDYVRKQIEAGGGVVLKDFDKSQRTQYKLFLIANTYCRTKKYFLALAFNMPCISNLWIRDCSRMGKLQSHKAYLLPAGETLDGDIVEWKPNRCILSGLKILVMSTHIQVENTWRSILMAAGCNIVARFPTINELNRGGVPFDCSVLVTDPTCPRHILHRAQQLEIPVVSVEWVMQSLINGVRMPYESHYKFSWDYKEKLK